MDAVQEEHPVRSPVQPVKAIGQLVAAAPAEHRDNRRVLQQNGLRVVEVSVPGIGGDNRLGGVQQNVEGIAGIAGDVFLTAAVPAVQQDFRIAA